MGTPSAEPPRLTSFLRVAAGAAPYDVDAAALRRQEQLSRLARAAPAASQLAQRLFGRSGAGGAREGRAALSRFLQSVQACLGGEAPPEQLEAAALAAYDSLEAPGEPQAALRRAGVEASSAAAAAAATAAEALRRCAAPAARDTYAPRAEWGSELRFTPPGGAAEAAEQPPAAASAESAADEVLSVFRCACDTLASVGALGGAGGDDWQEVAPLVAQQLLSAAPADAAAAALLELFGFDCFETVEVLLSQRAPLAAALRARLSSLRASLGAAAAAPAEPPPPAPLLGGLVVRDAAEASAAKARRKDERRQAKRTAASGGEPLLDWLQQEGVPFGALLEARAGEWAAGVAGGDDPMGLGFGKGDKPRGVAAPSLPPGSRREVRPGYETVTVPPPPPAPRGEAEPPLFPISQLAQWEQAAFEGYRTLNRIQTRIEPIARRGAVNVLVCAPTGAGKTNIAMLAILRELALRRLGGGGDDGAAAEDGGGGGGFDTADFKVVYVAPMKALAAEVAAAFGARLAPLGMRVRELTGDMQLTRRELAETHMLVTTPEKWDVVTRKGGEGSAAAAAALLILDEVHLLAEERGAVLEALVARTRRQVEAQQRPIRLLGLSATLPNPGDVAAFLSVPPAGLFVFDDSFRPVPLTRRFVGVSEPNAQRRLQLMNSLAFDEALAAVRAGKQAMVFVHSRAETGRTARALAEAAAQAGAAELFAWAAHEEADAFARDLGRSRNRELLELAPKGFGLHHAGMLRPDRSLAERLFSRGGLKVLVCTATLAWGVNLPAHTVVIKGTQVYDAARGGFKDLGVLDVAQIFGRAGRPQFDDAGEGVIITQHGRLAHYLQMLTQAVPIESHFIAALRDNLNAEAVLGTVCNVREGVAWLGHSFWQVRCAKNPLAYGLTWAELRDDPGLSAYRGRLLREAARSLDAARLIRFDERSGQVYTTDAGRIAAHFYLRFASMEVYNEMLQPHMGLAALFAMVSRSAEFENLAPREEEMAELEALASSPACPVDIAAGLSTKEGKANALIQAYISRHRFDSFSLTADSTYIAASVVRICRALAELVLRRGWPSMASAMLTLAKAAERRMWPQQHPLRQFEALGGPMGRHAQQAGPGAGGLSLPPDVLRRLEEKGGGGRLDALAEMGAAELAALTRSNAAIGARVAACVAAFPRLELSASVQPLTRTVLRVSLRADAPFAWREGAHGGSLRWHVWVEDQENEHIYHSEVLSLSRRQHAAEGGASLAFTIPIFEPLPPQYYVRAVSESWLGCEATLELSLRDVRLPGRGGGHTELLPLRPLPRAALQCAAFESLYERRFSHFNSVQTQAFHALYRTDDSVLLGAPTGSGKTVSAELAILRSFATQPRKLVLYIAPLKALVRERVSDWGAHFCPRLGKKLVELTGDAPADARALQAAHLVVATPEKWDAVSRSWGARAYVQRVGTLVIDEIHLLGADRGPVLEMIVSRMRYIAAATDSPLRVVGLSTALANAGDVADWLAVPPSGLFNFKPAVRPVPLEVHIQGYPGGAYCPRMATMNKPTYAAIKAHAPDAPTIVFVASRRQTRLTALELLALAASDEDGVPGGHPHRFLRAPPEEAAGWAARVRDPSLAHALQHGVAMHHAGLAASDRELSEQLFLSGAVRVLVATATLAWGVNLPAHLVVVKGTEYYDGAAKRYVDFPITDVLQMMGRAGRPQFDTSGTAVILVHEPKKAFYKKFLYEPFPVESSLAGALADHLNAEIAGGTVTSRQDAVDFLTWSYLYRRVLVNPGYYELPGGEPQHVAAYLSRLVEEALAPLAAAGCVQLDAAAEGAAEAEAAEAALSPFAPPGGAAGGWRREPAAGGARGGAVRATELGRIASRYYLRHATAATLQAFALRAGPTGPKEALAALAAAAEFDELPVRHNEEHLNAALAASVAAAGGWAVGGGLAAMELPGTKAGLLLQAHMLRLPMPVSDYQTDLKGVLENAQRILQAAVDAAAAARATQPALSAMRLLQCLAQARHPATLAAPPGCSAAALPAVSAAAAERLRRAGLGQLGQLAALAQQRGARGGGAEDALRAAGLAPRAAAEAAEAAARLPLLGLSATRESGGCSARLARLAPPSSRAAAAPGLAPAKQPLAGAGWWLLAIQAAPPNALLALRRLQLQGGGGASAQMPLPPDADGDVRLMLVSDSLLGLDQEATLASAGGEARGRPAPLSLGLPEEAAGQRRAPPPRGAARADAAELACAGADDAVLGEGEDAEAEASRAWDAANGLAERHT